MARTGLTERSRSVFPPRLHFAIEMLHACRTMSDAPHHPSVVRYLDRRRLLSALAVLLGANAAVRPEDAAAAQAARFALVIGNAAYRVLPPLATPPADASDVAAMLRGLGFETELALDAGLEAMRAALAALAARAAAARAELALVYYAGHGVQVGGENYLIPVDAQVRRAADLEASGVPLRTMLAATAPAAARAVILDACRDDPFAPPTPPRRPGVLEGGGARARDLGGSDDSGRGLARVAAAAPGTLVLFATSSGRVALDGPPDGNSPFANALLDLLGEPGLGLSELAARVRREVALATGGQQVPWDLSAPGASLVLRPSGLPRVSRPRRRGTRVTAAAPAPSEVLEITKSVAFAARWGLPLPAGLALRRPSPGAPGASLVGGWEIPGRQLLIVLAASPATRTAEIVYSGVRELGALRAWWALTAELEGEGVLSFALEASRFLMRWSDASGGWFNWSGRAGNIPATMGSVPFRRLD